jgi:hypothetical protein
MKYISFTELPNKINIIREIVKEEMNSEPDPVSFSEIP